MIRRDVPWGAADPKHWLLISQVDHARLSFELAAAWGNASVPALVCPPDDFEHPLAATLQALLDAVDHHDDGWLSWRESPGIDPKTGRPYSFTEMPPADAQRIWTESIEACRAFGPFAGWLVAAHFSALQSKRDGDYPEWVAWLEEVDRQRAGWLAEWLGRRSERHTQQLADRCLAWLQAFDWMSLWLCCRCPVARGGGDGEPLVIGDDETGWPEVTFKPLLRGDESERRVQVSPWPFAKSSLRLSVPGTLVPVKDYRSEPIIGVGRAVRVSWRLVPPDR
ncbi:MAG: DUF3891 family protein [Planctomycetota bacterium]